MEKIGVEAVVEGLSSFLGDMNKVDKSIAGIIPSTSLLGRALSGLGDVVSGVANSALRVFEYVLGNLVADAIGFVTDQIRELISTTIEAGSEFQSLEIRLRNFNLNTALETTDDFTQAMSTATSATREQLEWIQKLAVTTPYDATDIANVYTLARSYSFADDKSRELTESIASFAAGMGLGNTEIERIIVNFGQMVQQGKVTQREMNDLARGAFVPVNDVLQRMQEQTGLTGDAFDDFRNSAEGVDAFMKAFVSLVGERFTGSTQAMARTWQGATSNVKDFVKSLFGLNVVKPILDTLGENIAGFLDAFTSEDRLASFQALTQNIGGTLQGIVGDILNVGPTADEMAGMFENALTKINAWLIDNKDEIVAWVQSAQEWINTKLIPAIQNLWDWLFGTDTQTGAFHDFGTWLKDEFIPLVQDASKWVSEQLIPFFRDDLIPVFLELLPLASAIGDVLLTAFGGEPNQSISDWIHNSLIPGIQNLTKFLTENKDQVAEWIRVFLTVALVVDILKILIGVVISVLTTVGVLITVFMSVAKVVSTVYTGLQWLSALLMTSVPAAFGVVIAIIIGVIAQFKFFEFAITQMIGSIKILASAVTTWFTLIKNNIINTITQARNAILNGDWGGVGSAIIQGMYRGIIINAHLIINTLRNLAYNALSAAKAALGINSPSKEFITIGSQLMQGLAKGIAQSAGLATDAIKDASMQTVMVGAKTPAKMLSQMAMNGTVTNNNTQNYNLQVNTSAPSEPIIQDFNMMQSLAT